MKTKLKLTPGERVMCRSNEDEPLMLGEYVRPWCDKFPQVPVVLSDAGQEWICMGKVLPWDEELFETLGNYSPKEQWDLLCQMGLRTPKLPAHGEEKDIH